MTEDRRWPRWVYGEGAEPDVRFTFANERTFLAWIRTSLALLAGGVAIDALDVLSGAVQRAATLVLLALAAMCAASSFARWARAERAIRRREPLPSSPATAVLAVGVLALVVVVLWVTA